MDIELGDAWQRVEWAQSDMRGMSEGITSFRHSNPYLVSTHREGEGDRWEVTFLRVAEEQVEEEAFRCQARLIGSFLDHMRAALNYLMYQVALAALTQEPALAGQLIPESVEFPLFTDRRAYDQKNRIKKLPEELRRRIESVQPYHGGNYGLRLLHELAREYRHRVIHPVACMATGAVLGFAWPFPGDVTDLEIMYTGGALNHGDNICTFSGPSVDRNVYPNLEIAIGIDHPLCHGLTQVEVVNTINRSVVAVMEEWGASPLVFGNAFQAEDPYR
jgi:hypothetical protein